MRETSDVPTGIGTARRWLIAAAIALAAAVLPVGTAGAAQSGPIALLAIDAEDCGPGGHGPIESYAALVDAMVAGTANGGSGVLVLGGGGYCVTSFWEAIGTATGIPITYAGGGALADVSFDGHALLAVVSDATHTPGGLSSGEHGTLTARRQEIATFINDGGGLLGFNSDHDEPYAYITGVGGFSVRHDHDINDITVTAAGSALGLTAGLSVCCWHGEFTGYPGFLSPLATSSSGAPVAVGGVNPAVGDIVLDPGSQALLTGETAVVSVAVQEAGGPSVGRSVELRVQSGPNAGLVLHDTTDSEGRAGFTYSSSAGGTDLLRATFTDDNLIVHESNAGLVEWAIPNRAPDVSAGPGYSGSEGSAVMLSGTASDPDGDPLTLSWSYMADPGGAPLDPGTTCSFSAPGALSTAFTCTDDGTFYVTLSADDGRGPSSDSVAVTVLENVAPVLGVNASLDGVVAPLGSTLSASTPFTDAGTNDTHTCAVAWDDGTAPVAGSVAQDAGSGTCASERTPSGTGVYTVSTTVTDDDGGSAMGTAIAVIFDPNGGSVAGAGSIDSPAGAYAANPLAAGEAKFGFTSRYFKGAHTPRGDTDFRYRSADFSFHSTSYDWLVVAGRKAQFKGWGEVNKAPGFQFLLTASDGDAQGGDGLDRFRLKVWEAATGFVIYDNVRGSSDDMDASGLQEITRGRVQIRKA